MSCATWHKLPLTSGPTGATVRVVDWSHLVQSRQRLQTLFTGFVIVGGALDAPPAEGEERSWLESWIAEAKGFLKNLAKLPADKAREAAQTLKGALDHAADAAKEHAPDLLAPLDAVGKALKAFVTGALGTGLVLTALGVWLLFEYGDDLAKLAKYVV